MKRERLEKSVNWVMTIVVSLLTVVIGLSIYVTVFTLDTTETLAREAMYDASKIVTQHIDNYFDALILFDNLAMKNWGTSKNFIEQAIENETFAQQLVKHYPFITSLQYGDEFGNFVMYRKDVLGNINTKIILTDEELAESQRKPTTIWRYYNESELVREVIIDDVDFDPRTRPWYIGAKDKESLYMTEPYEFFTDKVIGITAANRHVSNGKLLGIYSFDISLDQIVSFLSELNLSNDLDTFIVTAKYEVIGLLKEPLSEKTYSGFVNVLDDVMIDQISEDKLGKVQSFRYAGGTEKYYVIYNRVLKGFAEPWYICIREKRSTVVSEHNWYLLLNSIISVALILLTIFLLLYRFRLLKIQDKLQIDASHDKLTGLLNRYSLDEISEHLLLAHRERSEKFSVILGDVDSFKELNDRYGHILGDTILVKLSGLIEGTVRKSDYACRWGGEEFLIILPDTTKTTACDMAHSLLNRISDKPVETDYGEISVTMSFGIATYRGGESIEDVIKRADDKLYRAKQTGKNRVFC